MTQTTWIKRIYYNDGGRQAAGFKASAEDCVARTFSILTGMGYMNTRNFLQKFIERERSEDRSNLDRGGVQTTTIKRALTKIVGAKVKMTRTSDWATIPTDGKFLVLTEEHAVAYVDGVINDTFDPTCVKSVGKLIGYYKF